MFLAGYAADGKGCLKLADAEKSLKGCFKGPYAAAGKG